MSHIYLARAFGYAIIKGDFVKHKKEAESFRFRLIGRIRSLYGYDFFDFGNFFLDHAFDPCFEGQGGHGAAFAGTLEANFDDSVFTDVDEFDVSAISLDRGSDLVEDSLYLLSFYHFDFLLVGEVQ